MKDLMLTANGRLTLKKWKSKQAAVSSMLVLSMFITSSLVTVASAAELYNLNEPLINSVKSNNTRHASHTGNAKTYRFNFRYREEIGVPQRLYSKDEILAVDGFYGSEYRIESNPELYSEQNLEQYDATIYYALGDGFQNLFSRHQWLSIDLGVNFKFIEQIYDASQQHQNNYRTHYGAYPMFSAAALFDLPLSGVTASVEGRYFNYKTNELSEYRAKLSYQFDNIFGVSGGWEQQQYQLESSDSLRFDKEGPFVDLFYRF